MRVGAARAEPQRMAKEVRRVICMLNRGAKISGGSRGQGTADALKWS